jgi:hypothetical protein
MNPRHRTLLGVANVIVLIAVWTVWRITRQHPGGLPPLRICGAELIPDVADEPWVCIREPHSHTVKHKAMDGATWWEL